MTIDEALEYGKSKGFSGIERFGGIQFFSDPWAFESNSAVKYVTCIIVVPKDNQWHLRDVRPFATFDSLQEAVLTVEKCLDNDDFYNDLKRQAKEKENSGTSI